MPLQTCKLILHYHLSLLSRVFFGDFSRSISLEDVSALVLVRSFCVSFAFAVQADLGALPMIKENSPYYSRRNLTNSTAKSKRAEEVEELINLPGQLALGVLDPISCSSRRGFTPS